MKERYRLILQVKANNDAHELEMILLQMKTLTEEIKATKCGWCI